LTCSAIEIRLAKRGEKEELDFEVAQQREKK